MSDRYIAIDVSQTFKLGLTNAHTNVRPAVAPLYGVAEAANPRALCPRTGGAGITPACPNNRATVSLGCAPHESQYLMRSTFRPTCLCPSRRAIGS